MPPLSLGFGVGLSRGSSRRFSPLELSPALWLRSDLGVTLNGSTVSAWADQSGNGRHFTQGTGAAQPNYDATGGPTGGPSIELGGARWMQGAGAATSWNFLHSAGYTTIFVARISAANPNTLVPLIGTAQDGVSQNGMWAGFDDRAGNSRNDTALLVVVTGATYNHVAVSANNAWPAGAWASVEYEVAASNAYVRRNGVQIATSALNGTLPTNASNAAVLGRITASITAGDLVKLVEVISMPTPSAAARGLLSAYFLGRYGVAG